MMRHLKPKSLSPMLSFIDSLRSGMIWAPSAVVSAVHGLRMANVSSGEASSKELIFQLRQFMIRYADVLLYTCMLQ